MLFRFLAVAVLLTAAGSAVASPFRLERTYRDPETGRRVWIYVKKETIVEWTPSRESPPSYTRRRASTRRHRRVHARRKNVAPKPVPRKRAPTATATRVARSGAVIKKEPPTKKVATKPLPPVVNIPRAVKSKPGKAKTRKTKTVATAKKPIKPKITGKKGGGTGAKPGASLKPKPKPTDKKPGNGWPLALLISTIVCALASLGTGFVWWHTPVLKDKQLMAKYSLAFFVAAIVLGVLYARFH